MEPQHKTIRQAMDEARALGFNRSLSWWRIMVNKGKIRTTLGEVTPRNFVRLIREDEFKRVLIEKPGLKVVME